MTKVGSIKADVLLRVQGSEELTFIGEVDIPIRASIGTPTGMTVRADTSGVQAGVEAATRDVHITLDGRSTVGAMSRDGQKGV